MRVEVSRMSVLLELLLISFGSALALRMFRAANLQESDSVLGMLHWQHGYSHPRV